MEFGLRLKKLRKTIGYTQTEMGRFLGLTASAMSDIERGVNKPSKTLVEYMKYRYPEVFGDHVVEPSFDLKGPKLLVDESQKGLEENIGKLPHEDLVKHFRQADLAWEINWDLLKLEMVSPAKLEEVKQFIKFQLSMTGTTSNEESDDKDKKGTA